ncbi:F-box domain-containing protein [Mycena venus]|uniref:F-box domain-containing protein n=1 Tax=Mycena venus TaxID=2733690 RepID=A0A8H6Y2G1_9AGAR|nr:F-box domain-containing protein [Mycena venus]
MSSKDMTSPLKAKLAFRTIRGLPRLVWKRMKMILRRRKTRNQIIAPEARIQRADPMAVSYVSVLPPEILAEIMILCYNPCPQFWGDIQQSHNIPIYLTQISSSWRRLALLTPDLWSAVTLTFNEQRARSTRRITAFAESWLAKGRPGKLALHLDMGFIYDFDDDCIEKEPIGRLIAAHAHNWQRLTLARAPDNMAVEVIGRLAENKFPSLERIELHAFASVWNIRFDALVSLPHLRSVHLRTWRTPSSLHNINLLFLPWTQLDNISISAPASAEKWLTILPHCSGLAKLEIWICSDTVAKHGTPLTSSFWESHAAQLRSLCLSNLYFHDELRSLFLTLPNLTLLELSPREIRLAAPDFDALRVEQLLPALTHLDIAVGYAPGVPSIESVRSAIALLETRAAVSPDAGVACLARVVLADWTDWDEVEHDLPAIDQAVMERELDRLRALKAQGMNVRWEVKGYDMLVPRDDVQASMRILGEASQLSTSSYDSNV